VDLANLIEGTPELSEMARRGLPVWADFVQNEIVVRRRPPMFVSACQAH
jgi:hypothetical protein